MQHTRRLLRVIDRDDDPATIEEHLEAATLLRTTARLATVPEPPREEPEPAAQIEPETVPGKSRLGRVFALTLLTLTVAGLSWLGTQVYFVVSDSWIAPLHLSPNSDAVAQVRLQHQRLLAEFRRLDAEVSRLDNSLGGITDAIAKLERLRNGSRDTLAWQAELSRLENRGLTRSRELLVQQRELLGQLHARQLTLVDRARADLAAGLIDRTAHDREKQVRDQLALELSGIELKLAEQDVKHKHNRDALKALRASAGDGIAPDRGRMPEVAAGDERDLRLEIEIQRLRAEARGLRAQRAAAAASVEAQRAALGELESRPMYRAMTAITDVAFVPYDQLTDIAVGSKVMTCVWGVFACGAVGQIVEILPGEVVTQDPWGKLARGQYVILSLDDKDAIRERVLRVRH